MAEPSAVIANLDARLDRVLALCEQMSADYTAFMEHLRTADQLWRALQAEAAEDRVKASEVVRINQRIGAMREAAQQLVQAIAKASVGAKL